MEPPGGGRDVDTMEWGDSPEAAEGAGRIFPRGAGSADARVGAAAATAAAAAAAAAACAAAASPSCRLGEGFSTATSGGSADTNRGAFRRTPRRARPTEEEEEVPGFDQQQQQQQSGDRTAGVKVGSSSTSIVFGSRGNANISSSSSSSLGSGGTPSTHHAAAAFEGGEEEAAAAAVAAGGGRVGGGSGDFLCYECGLDFRSVKELQLHMVRKTAWSNQGLVGCRVSCLVDNREWHEGIVTQYHKSGKHCVEYRRSGEKRWVNMLKTAFYIVERVQPSGGEVKEMEPDPTEGLAPIEKWHYQEDISPEFCVALSLLHRAYGCRIQETGHKTVGHTCVTDRDKVAAKEVKGSLLYGELLPRGVNKAMGPKHLNAAKASTIYDLGMGTGKVAMQVFLQFPNLSRVYGIELSQARFELGEAALFALMELQPGAYAIKEHVPGRFMSIETLPQRQDHQRQQQQQQQQQPSLAEGGAREAAGGGGGGWESICRGAAGRTLEFACGNLFDVDNIAQADLVLLETDVSSDVHPQLSRFLTGLRKGAQALTYLDLRKMWNSMPFPYRQVEVNRSLSDRFPTSWSVQRGHHFFLWSKTHPHPPRETSTSSSLLQAPLDNAAEGSLTLVEGDKRRDRQGVPIGSACLRRGSLSGGGGGGGGDGCGRSDSGRIGGYSGSGTVGGTVVGAGREGLAQVKGRRSGGHPKFRFPFLKCLGFGRRGRKPPLPPPPRATAAAAAAEAAVAAAYAEGLAPAGFVGVPEPTTLAKEGKRSFGDGDVGDGVGEPSLQELYLLDASGGGGGAGGGGASDRLATIAGGQVELQGAAEGGGYLEGSGRRARSGVAETERVARQSSSASRSKPRYVPPPPPPGLEVVQQGSSRGQELTEAAELGLVGSPPVGGAGGAGSSESSEGCTAM